MYDFLYEIGENRCHEINGLTSHNKCIYIHTCITLDNKMTTNFQGITKGSRQSRWEILSIYLACSTVKTLRHINTVVRFRLGIWKCLCTVKYQCQFGSRNLCSKIEKVNGTQYGLLSKIITARANLGNAYDVKHWVKCSSSYSRCAEQRERSYRPRWLKLLSGRREIKASRDVGLLRRRIASIRAPELRLRPSTGRWGPPRVDRNRCRPWIPSAA